MENLLNEQEEENKIPGEQKEVVEAETGTAESGVNEAATEDKPLEGNVDSGDVGKGDTDVNPEPELEPELEPEVEPEVEPEGEKTLTQSQVNELVGKARAEGRAAGKAEAMSELYGRYGVNDDNEMNDIFGKGQGYDVLNEEYQGLNTNFKNLSAENALLKSGVALNRFDDVKAILEHKGLEVTVENIQAEAPTHSEWFKNNVPAGAEQTNDVTMQDLEAMGEAAKPAPVPTEPSTIRKLGVNAPETKIDSEKENVLKMFGL